ncbi:MarR family winged helix-turn-helix transcriptional regulator [Micromonospora sp. NPDC000316]|uniref:MarR family winged helix-turn-helix transcriptional regulator n=1 Tax=Micromonospora sp. NPDC000316 TaxID=3364216 RepID=UPI0036B57297
MAELPGPPDPETSMAAALDAAAGALLSVWDSAREATANRLSGVQLRAVMVVEHHDGINLRRLSNRLDMLLSSASRLCDRLVAAGMLEREPGRFDRREISLHLTPEARRLLAELRADRQARLAAVLAGMSPAGRTALLRGIRDFDEAARRQRTQSMSTPDDGGQPRGRGDWPSDSDWPDDADEPRGPGDPDRPTGRPRDWSADPDRPSRTMRQSGPTATERPVGSPHEWPTGEPPVARTA